MKNDGNDKLRAWIEQAQFTVTSPAHAPHVNVPIQVVTVEGLLAALASGDGSESAGLRGAAERLLNEVKLHREMGTANEVLGTKQFIDDIETLALTALAPAISRPPTQGELGPMNSKGHWGPCTNPNHNDSQEGPCERHWIVDPDLVG